MVADTHSVDAAASVDAADAIAAAGVAAAEVAVVVVVVVADKHTTGQHSNIPGRRQAEALTG